MQNSLRKMLARMFADKKRQRRIVAVVCVLSVLVITTVFTELMQPVITMTPDPVCGLAEHVHSSDCFADQLACGVEESGEHAHGDGCYKSVLACGKSEHSHTEDCYPEKVEEQKVTVIQPTETPAAEAPATEAPVQPEVMSISEEELSVEATTEPAAEVSAEPTTEVTVEPATEVTVEPTTEVTVEAAVEPTTEPTAAPAPAVAVTAVSAEKVFVGQTVTWTVEASGEAELTYYIADESGAEIVSGALDVDASYISWLADRAGAFTLTVTAANETGSASANGSVTVEASEALVAAALADQLYCFAGEEITFRFAYSGGVEPASVSIAVYQDGQVLTELTEFAETVAVTPANLGEKATTVTAEITVTDSLGSMVTGVCEIPCAVRTRETESDWEKSTRVDLTGEWPEDLVAVAKTQLGYEESEINFIVNDEGERQGYTRYGQWYGSSYAEWCAMFVSFDLNYAEIPEKYFPREANCEKWISALKARSLYESAKGDYEPEVGDLVFFDWEDNNESDHVGIITAVTDKKIETIEGNVDKGVRRCDYDRDDEVLYGYGCVLEAYEKYLCDELDLDLEAGIGAQAIVTAETANLRAEADADSELVAQLAIDTVVEVVAAEQNRAEIWYQVAAGELTGYIRSDLVEINYVAEEELIPVAADYDSLMNRIAELPFDGSEAHALAAAGIADDAAFAYESGVITYEQYAEIMIALTEDAVMTADEPAVMTLMEVQDGDYTIQSIVRKATYNNNAYSTATITFQPVDSEGNALNEVYRPSNFRYTFVRSTWNSSNFRDTCANVADFQNALDGGSIYDVKINVNGSEADAEYITILNTGYIQYGDSANPSTKLTTTNAYFVVYYVPASFNVTYTDGSGSELLIDSAYNRECYAIPAVPGYELNTYVEGKGYMCGWQDASGNTYLYKVDMVEGDITLEPYWSADPIASYTVTFDVNGFQTQQTVLTGRTFGDLVAPDAARDGYRFDGWFTAEDESGVQYTAATVISESVTLYARYTEYIDVSFVINDSNYTNDPGSGYTHVTVNSIEGLNADGFTYTLVGTGDRYRVSGTGTLVTFTIPAGESLSMNGLSTVAINVENQVENGGTSSNTYTYVSTYSWLDGAKVCNANTIFNADTTLVLRLYQNDETYSLNFVCCEACGNSITFALSEAGVATTNPSFAVGESVDAAYFPADSDVNAYFSCNTCSACGRKTGEGETSMVLDYWYIIDENTPFTPGTAIGDTHVQLATGNSIPVYAAWKEAPNNVTVKFRNPDYSEISSSSEVTCYSEFGSIKPVDPTLDGCTFVGWTTDGGATLVADDYIVSADVTFTAVYDATISVQMPDLANGDLTTYTTVNTLTVRTGENLPADQISAPIVSNGYIRSSWMVETTGGSSVYTDLSGFGAVTKAATVKAQYEKGYTLTFQYHTEEMAEGEYAVAATYYVKAYGTIYDAVDADGNSANGAFPTLTVPGYTFNNWMDSNGNYASPSYSSYTADTVYTASLTALPAHTVTFQYITEGDGISEMTTAATYKTTSSEATLRDIIAAAEGVEAENAQLPACPQVMDTKYFAHWATADDAVATLDTVITGDTTFTAVFADKVHVKFQYSYEDAETEANITGIAGDCYVIPGQPLSTAMTELPVVELPGMRFGGWIETSDDGTQTQVTLDTEVTVDEGETEVVYSARLDTEISINFVYQDIMDSDDDGDTAEVITYAEYAMAQGEMLSTATRTVVINGVETVETLSEIPAPTFENYIFSGWYYPTEDGNAGMLTSLDLIANEDTIFTGIFEEIADHTVTLHDIDPDGKEKLPEGVESIDVLVPGGEALADYLPEVALTDRTADEVIKWYTLAEDGSKVEFDPTEPLTADVDLYTYTYRIVLTLAEETTEEEVASLLDILMPRAYAATVEIEDGQLVVEFSDGEKLSYADFVKDGVDYTLYSWTFTNIPEGSGIDSIDSLIDYANNSMQPGDVITASGQAQYTDVITATIDFRAYVDGDWITIKECPMTLCKVNYVYRLSGAQLESVYAKLGFRAENVAYTGNTNYTVFPFVAPYHEPTLYGGKTWNDTLFSTAYGGFGPAQIVYYMPGLPVTVSSTKTSALSDYKVDSNRFHSITVKDETDPIAYIRREGGTVTLEPRNGQVWKLAEGYEDSCTLADDGLTITNATGPIVVEPAGDVFYTVKVISPDGLLGVMPSPLEQEVKGGKNSTPVFLPTAREGYKWNIPADATYEVADVENGQTYTFTNVRSDIVVELMERQVFNVTISDQDDIFADVELPTIEPVYEGDSFTVTLPIPTVVDENVAEYSWFVDGVCEVNCANNGDGTLTYTISNVMSDVMIEVSSGEIYTLIYHVNAPTASDGTIDEVPTIAGAAEYTITVQYNGDGTATYTLLSPSLTEVIRTVQGSGQTYKKSHFFDGWMSAQDGTEAQFKAEEAALLSDIVALDTDGDKTIHLYGRWIDGALTQSLSYYVNLSGAMMTYDESGAHASNDFAIDANKGWTDGIYGTYMSITPMFTNGYGGDNPADIHDNGGVILYDQTSTSKSNVDSEHTTDYVIRNNLKSADGVNTKYSGGVERNFSIGYVPSDEDVLRKLREMQATYIQNYENSGYRSPSAYVNANNKLLIYEDTDEYIPVADLIPDNFSIKWYAVKYDGGNAWHIDGALIRKKAELIVQKTFYGDAEMISEVKGRTDDSKYYVSVTRNDRDATGTNYTLYLEDAEVNGNTYTWKLENVTGNRSYTVTEHNYFYDTEGKTTSAEYRVVNPTTGTSTIVSPGWHAYTDGVTVTTRAYADNETAYQTVELINRYVPTDELLISKVDTQGEFLSDVSFQVKKGDSVVSFYPKDNKYHMEAIEGIDPVTTLTTDADGSIWIVLPETENDLWNGTYTLIETHTPDEYNKIQNVTFVVEDGKITSVTPEETASVTNGNIMTVLNRSKTTNVAVQKIWTNAGDAKPVTLTLYKNGAAMPGMTVTLDGVVDGQETDEWYHRWVGLDLFAGGERIVYTVREDSIGSGDGIVNYDPKADATDGYADYIVSQNTKYYIYNNDEDKYVETTDYVNATDVIVAVSNTLDKGNVTFLKTDGENPLADAKFTIYSNAACTDEVKSALSDATGMVTFTDLNPGVYYVMKETGVPEGYVENTTIYTVQVSGNGFKIIDGEGNEIDTIVNTPIPDVDLTVKKVDDDGNALDGSEFQIKCGGNAYLYEDGDTSKIVPLIANSANGDAIHTIKVETSTDTYTINETTAPAGFYGLNGTISFKVTKGKVTDVSCPDGVQWDSNTNTFTVTNVPGVEIPRTGGVGTLPYMIGGLLLMAASLLYGIGLRRKGERGDTD